jgi:EmrB/QacA subfamily drug resistance transporter
MTAKSKMLWAFVLSSVVMFMTALDNLVVTTALPVIKQELGGGIETLEWTVNGYTLTFAVLLLTGAALGDRFGRRRMFVIGISVFTLGSAAAALAPSIELLIGARAFQGIGGAIVTPLSLTILTDAVPTEKRGVALGAWGGIAGLAIALGPLVGGAVTEGIAWQWIFWINVPIGLAMLPLARTRLVESHGQNSRLDLPGVALASIGLLGVVWALVRGNGAGWLSAEVVAATLAGIAALVGFVAWELRAPAPMLPMRFFGSRAFAAANAASLAMYFGMFGSVFLLTQFLQLVMGYSPLQAGLRTLAWTAMPVVVAPIAGALSDRIGGRPIMAFGLVLDAIAFGWMASIAGTDRHTDSSPPRSCSPASARQRSSPRWRTS